MARRRDKGAERTLARQRMERLLSLASALPAADAARSRRYVALARRVGMRYQAPLPAAWRQRVCRRCDAILVPGRSARVRLNRGVRAVTCGTCGTIARRRLEVRS